jgi:hypothetical protein
VNLGLARAVADAVLYEGYLLYPYRASSMKNRVRWQFGVLGPPGAMAAGLGEDSSMTAQCLLRVGTETLTQTDAASAVTVHLRFLQLQLRDVERAEPGDPGRFRVVDEAVVGGQRLLSWEEAVEHEFTLPSYRLRDPYEGVTVPVEVPGGQETESVTGDGPQPVRIVRRRFPLHAQVRFGAEAVDGFLRLSVSVENTRATPASDKDEAIRASLIGAHLLIEVAGAEFVSLVDHPADAAAAAASCRQHRCWPVLAGSPGDSDLVLASPIILYDYPEVAAESAGALFDSTEIDEILTLRVMTMTDEEKAQARATDPRAKEIIDRCDGMSPQALQQLHGILRDPHIGAAARTLPAAGDVAFDAVPSAPLGAFPRAPGRPDDIRNADPPSYDTGDVPWWDPAADASVRPEVDAVMIGDVSVRKGSLVRLRPSRRADAQDLFFTDQVARVTAVLSDVDGDVHVAVVLADDPAAEMHDWYGRYLYFAPDEIEPLTQATTTHGEENQS